jgi:hypothetical protein
MSPDSQRVDNIHASLENRPFLLSVTQNGLILNHAGKTKPLLASTRPPLDRVWGSEEAVKGKWTRAGGTGKGKMQHNTYDRTLKPQRSRSRNQKGTAEDAEDAEKKKEPLISPIALIKA